MDADTMLHHLEELARRLGIEVRYESAAGRVGMGVLRGARIAVVDADLRVPQRVNALATLLADQPIEGVYLPPEVREHLQACLPAEAPPGPDTNHDARPQGAGATPDG